MPNNFLSDILAYRMKIFSLIVKFDYARFKKTLQIKMMCNKFESKKKIGHTIGAKMISSYARKPYFSVSLFGRRTMKS